MASSILQTENDYGSVTSVGYSLLPDAMPSDGGSVSSDGYSYLPDAEPSTYLQNDDINHHNLDFFNFTNLQSAFTAAPSPDSIETVEIHSRLNKLIEENSQLKEKMIKNISWMENQININNIISWRDSMILSKKQVEKNLTAATERISVLVKENSELHQKLDSLIKLDETQRINSSKHTTREIGLNYLLAVDNRKENGDIKPEWNYFYENLNENLKFVHQNLKMASDVQTNQEEKFLLDCYISMLEFKISKESTDGRNQHFHNLIEEYKRELQDQDNKLICLEKEKGKLIEKVKEHEVKIHEMEVALKSELKMLNNNLQSESSLSQTYKERCENLQQQIKECEIKLEQNITRMSGDDDLVNELKTEMQQLQAIVKSEQLDKEDLITKHFEQMIKCEHLQKSYDEIKQLQKMLMEDGKEKDEKIALTESAAKQYKKDVDCLTAKLLETENQLEECAAELKTAQNGFGISDPGFIEALKIQIAVYKKDFMKLESAKNAISDEIARLIYEIKRYEENDCT